MMKEQLLDLLYKNQREIYGSHPHGYDEFYCLIALVEDGTISTFEELAKYGVEE